MRRLRFRTFALILPTLGLGLAIGCGARTGSPGVPASSSSSSIEIMHDDFTLADAECTAVPRWGFLPTDVKSVSSLPDLLKLQTQALLLDSIKIERVARGANSARSFRMVEGTVPVRTLPTPLPVDLPAPTPVPSGTAPTLPVVPRNADGSAQNPRYDLGLFSFREACASAPAHTASAADRTTDRATDLTTDLTTDPAPVRPIDTKFPKSFSERGRFQDRYEMKFDPAAPGALPELFAIAGERSETFRVRVSGQVLDLSPNDDDSAATAELEGWQRMNVYATTTGLILQFSRLETGTSAEGVSSEGDTQVVLTLRYEMNPERVSVLQTAADPAVRNASPLWTEPGAKGLTEVFSSVSGPGASIQSF